MVNKKVIQTLYRQFNKAPKSPDELNIGLLFDFALDNHGICIDEENLYIGSVDPASPFATLALRRIHEIVEFEKVIAIVLPAAIVFLNKENSDVNIHLRLEDEAPSMWGRLKRAVAGA
ncbi:MAG: hypothetical protein K2K92_01365 [Duncaniella sp.]|nr:hypothetical protein [Duncaniella sp.]